MPSTLTKLPFLIAAVLLCGSAAAQQKERVSVSVLNSRVAVGEIGQYFITVRNGEASLPQRIAVDGLEVIYSGSQLSSSFINGRQSFETTHFYRFKGNQPGTYVIPEIEFQIGNEAAKTKPVTVTIYENNGQTNIDATKPYFAKLEANRNTFYVNEIVPFTVTAYVQGRNSLNGVVSVDLQHESFVIQKFSEVRDDSTEVGNSYYSAAAMPSHFFALKAGEFRLGPGQVVVRTLDRDSGFGISFPFARTAAHELATNTLNLTVKPLPDNAPASFTGGVGSFEMVARPPTTTLAIGDPVSMEFEVTGVGNLRTMTAPVFSVPQTGIWKTYEASKTLTDEEDSDGFKSGTARFSQVLIPEARTKSIPEFHLTYFDPAKEEYVTVKAGPFDITLNEAAAIAAPAPVAVPGASADLPDARAPEPAFDDILHIRTGPPRWIASYRADAPGPWFLPVQLLFSVAFFTVIGFGVARWIALRGETTPLRVEEVSFARARKQLPKPGAPRRDYYRAVLRALEAWKREHPGAPAPVREVVDRTAERCSAILYSGQNEGDTPVTPAETEEISGRLQRLASR